MLKVRRSDNLINELLHQDARTTGASRASHQRAIENTTENTDAYTNTHRVSFTTIPSNATVL